ASERPWPRIWPFSKPYGAIGRPGLRATEVPPRRSPRHATRRPSRRTRCPGQGAEPRPEGRGRAGSLDGVARHTLHPGRADAPAATRPRLMPASRAVLEVRGVSRSYRRGDSEVRALRDVSFSVDEGGSVAIMGPSGSGKTTLLNIVAGLDRPTVGDVFVDGQRLSDMGPDQATAFRPR